ncbi:hypothetical protein [Secundilactobacillus kimchicus]|uniref:hypothetical protein n=1 Tax=Secundilactobacillus kimchicus TaxID=528209 RepID=UPI0024A9986C|nr:hypothetical protein [Secundilactobacillus kimchicus]
MAQYGTETDFRIAPELSFTLPANLTDTGATIKAGTPVGGADNLLLNADAELAVTTDATTQGLLLHTTDTKGGAFATVMTEGFVNLNRLSEDVQALITDDIKTALPKITFLKR